MAKPFEYKVPFDRDGNLLHYPGWRTEDSGVDWRDNEIFVCTLQMQEGVTSGRSAKYVHWAPPAAMYPRFPMFVVDLVALVHHAQVEKGGIVSGRWRVRKRGANYGLVYCPVGA